MGLAAAMGSVVKLLAGVWRNPLLARERWVPVSHHWRLAIPRRLQLLLQPLLQSPGPHNPCCSCPRCLQGLWGLKGVTFKLPEWMGGKK